MEICNICYKYEKEIRSKYCEKCNFTLNTIEQSQLKENVARAMRSYYKKQRDCQAIIDDPSKFINPPL